MPNDHLAHVSTIQEHDMAQPVQYVLSHPFFISSRLMPAVNVADATIHMQAHTIDRDDEHDPRVVWQYTIDGPDLYHAGRDLTTPYAGPATVAGQLPTAMGTMLGYLSHVADVDPGEETSLPDTVYQWARRNRNEITMVADLVEDGPHPMPASAVWWDIIHDPDQTPYGRWCAGQATAHADRLATLNPHRRPASGLVVRDEQWHETARAWYTMLTDQPEPKPATASACLVADRDAILGWLRGPAPDRSTASMALYLGLNDAGLDWRRIPDLVEQAQLAGVFGVAGHTIVAHPVVDERTGLIAHLLTITTPHGASLATVPIPAASIALGDTGPYAVSHVLGHYAARVGNAVAAHWRRRRAGPVRFPAST